MRTSDPRRTEDPAAGDCDRIRPAGWDERWKTTVAKSPATFNCRTPGASAKPLTDGAWTVPLADDEVVVVATVVVVDGAPLPVETFSVTFEPLSTSEPDFGFCATTLPAGFAAETFCSPGFNPPAVNAFTADPCDWPTTCGTITGFAPLDTLSCTVVPRAAVTPATGDCATTTPFGRDDATRVTSFSKPALVRRCCASSSCSA